MEHKLALALGLPVVLMKSIMPRSEYMAWLSYFKYEEPDVHEIQLATLTMQVSNALGGKTKVENFLVRKPKQDPKTVKQLDANTLRGVFGGIAQKQK